MAVPTRDAIGKTAELNEARALVELAGQAATGLVGTVRDMHRAIAGRPFGALGLAGKPFGPIGTAATAPSRFLHDRISSAVYGALRTAGKGLATGAGAAAARLTREDGQLLTRRPAGVLAAGVMNGFLGDLLEELDSDLLTEVAFYDRADRLDIERGALARSIPDATPRIVVFIHGLCETEGAWRVNWSGATERTDYGRRLRDELGYTPLYLRYSTGLHVSEAARALSELLERTVAEWPVEVREIALVGHSMGGLVARGACYRGAADGSAWVPPVRHVFCLGTPHLGAPLEQAANAAGWALARLPETQPFAAIVNRRSVGIKDLRYGYCCEDDWCDCDADALLQCHRKEIPFLDTAAYYFVGATITREPDHPIGRAMGDLLVRLPSAWGQGLGGERYPFELDRLRSYGGMHHMHLLNHPAVYEQLRDWLQGPRRDLPAAKSA
ncbi:MAG: esterase/lipase family protein [Thermoleophilaceae bacterium]